MQCFFLDGLPQMAIGGHCLVCSRDESLHISKRGAQCNESALGLCSMKTCYIVTQQIFNRKIYPFRLPVKYFFYFFAVSGNSLNSSQFFEGTMNSYWTFCKANNKFITGNTRYVCQNDTTWTGIRKYRIDIGNIIPRPSLVSMKLSL